MAYEFKVPDKIIIGEDALKKSAAALKKLGNKALIVTGKVVLRSKAVVALTELLCENDIKYAIFSEIVGEPTDEMIASGVTAYKENNCDFLIGIGGGSPLDSVKAIALMSTSDKKLADYMGKEIIGDFPPFAMIPTTAGTGSEVTKMTIITDTQTKVKMLLLGEKLIPNLAIVDPAFSKSMPKGITAATGMDALAHAVESYTSRKHNEMTDLFALSAIEKIFKNLPIAYTDGENEKAREEMAIAALEAGICINNASVTIVHGMSRPIGALFHVPHGMSNAILMVECFRYVLDGCYERFATIARKIGAADEKMPDKEAAECFLSALEELCRKIEIPTLTGYGIDQKKFLSSIDKMANDAIISGSPANTIKEISKEAIVSIYERLCYNK